MAKVEWTDDAIEDLSRLDKPIIRRILKKVSWFSNNFDSITPESLSGDWRVVYTIENDLILIQAVGHRREIYKKG